MSRPVPIKTLVAGLATLSIAASACLPSSFVEPRIPAADRVKDPDGSAARGRDILLNRTFARYGVPLSVVRASLGLVPDLERVPPVPGRRGLNRFVPIPATSVDASGVSVAYPNCFTCHAGMVDGRLYLGIGNSFVDHTVDVRSTPLFNDNFVSGLHLSRREKEEFLKWRDYTAMYAGYTVTTSPGTSPAISITAYLLAHRTPGTYAWSETPFVEIPQQVVETDIPAWYGVKKKKSLYFGGEAKGNGVRHLMQFFSVPGNTRADLDASEVDFQDVLAFMRQLQPPRYPYAVDPALALQGKTIFEASCSSCHGTYGADWTYPEKIVPIWQIGTDRVRWDTSRSPGAIDHYNKLWHGESGAWMELTEGYVAPPLDGVWVTAPYLHNGSVPSLEDLLAPEDSRPRYFIRGKTSRSYDPGRVGWTVEVVDHGKAGEPDPARRAKIYDTDQYGKSNRGHRFGTDLPRDQKVALIEYLKTL
jgi:cytochrome c5